MNVKRRLLPGLVAAAALVGAIQIVDVRQRAALEKAYAEEQRRKQAEVDEAVERYRQQSQAAQTTNLLREQLERDECIRWLRAFEFDPMLEFACAIPESSIRVSLRARRGE